MLNTVDYDVFVVANKTGISKLYFWLVYAYIYMHALNIRSNYATVTVLHG